MLRLGKCSKQGGLFASRLLCFGLENFKCMKKRALNWWCYHLVLSTEANTRMVGMFAHTLAALGRKHHYLPCGVRCLAVPKAVGGPDKWKTSKISMSTRWINLKRTSQQPLPLSCPPYPLTLPHQNARLSYFLITRTKYSTLMVWVVVLFWVIVSVQCSLAPRQKMHSRRIWVKKNKRKSQGKRCAFLGQPLAVCLFQWGLTIS